MSTSEPMDGISNKGASIGDSQENRDGVVEVTKAGVKAEVAVEELVAENNPHIIKEGDYVILCAGAKNNYKVVQVTKNAAKIRWFKHFVKVSALEGCYYGKHYEIAEDGVVESRYVDVLGESTEEHSGKDHRSIQQDYDSQKLSYEEITRLKKEGVSGEDMIKLLVENSGSFENRTEFSQAKYIMKKQKRHLANTFSLRRPTLPLLCDTTYQFNPERIQNIRSDSLAQVLTQANVHAGSRVLLLESCKGLVTAGVLERLGGYGECVSLYVGDKPSHPYVDQMNFDEKVMSTLRSFPLVDFDLASTYADTYGERIDTMAAEIVAKKQDVANGGEFTQKDQQWLARRIKKQQVMNNIYLAAQTLKKGSFDSAIMVSRFHPEGVMDRLLPKLMHSGQLVLFSVMPEVLVPIRNNMRARDDFVNASLFDTWTRSYQILPQRTHPENNMTGSSGYVLSATYVMTKDMCGISAFVPPPNKRKLIQMAKGGKKAKMEAEKVSEGTKEASDVETASTGDNIAEQVQELTSETAEVVFTDATK
ncbi:hypothetical protein SARC_01547 [Sphaeroforma arctica JP610]|uniref:tRNA (adenine(58)-N(1))-methyltransferase non-catalytic subunit TRM6 n=1 Tax=Sphaeroforma arctica JP610 TaxID=667725 RepID=A0A0L0GBA9_9EUKA|nr:hypothetical protein SARC_01547 [Sphaeroforma arctica JP610]KNC86285.1 hypothetical protein SARC_01547 [Sphaeroforma arctica JP610]|eukprot:XP_014160187.1 hypothetical protein SARC_01547 [Sphaeroforma arctica JP610]